MQTHQTWLKTAKDIKATDKSWAKRAQERLDSQTRPQGSLGRLEEAITQLAAIQKKEKLSVDKKRILIFASDHGVEQEGVSLFPKEVTKAMFYNFVNGGATINALARQTKSDIKVIDVGIEGEIQPHKDVVQDKVRHGSGNIKVEPAMTEDECAGALEAGWNAVMTAKEEGINLIGLGEMGIANTTPAAAVISALLKSSPAEITGRGTGLDDESYQHKIKVIEEALALHEANMTDPLEVLRHVGGCEIAAMTGAILACAHYSLPIVVDGIVVAASTLAAFRLNPNVLDYIFLAHRSEEQGHQHLFNELNRSPLLDLSMRLGEASGAALAFNILEAGVRVYNEVATFEEAQVANKKQTNAVG